MAGSYTARPSRLAIGRQKLSSSSTNSGAISSNERMRCPRVVRLTAAATAESAAAGLAVALNGLFREPVVEALGQVLAVVGPEFHVDRQRALHMVRRSRQFGERILR